jgi:hypothetical protein
MYDFKSTVLIVAWLRKAHHPSLFDSFSTIFVIAATMSSNLAQKYANAMTEHPYGYALFRPASSMKLQPGSCGYLDEQGKWNPVITNIEDTAELQRAGENISAPSPLIAMDPESHVWGPKVATDMTYKCTTFSGAADATAAGFPAEISIALEFSAKKDFGAVLHCAHQVEEHGFYHRDAFVQWAKANAQSLIDFCPDVKRYGVWIVTSTFETREVDILAWTGRTKIASMGFKVAVPAAGEIGPSGKFVKAGSAGGWNHDAKDVSHLPR